MRLFIATPSYYLEGGAERILEALGRNLPSRGIEVVFGLARGARFHNPARFRAAFPGIDSVDVEGRSGTAHGRREGLRAAILRVQPDAVLNVRLFDTYPACSALKQQGHAIRLMTTMQALEAEYLVDIVRYQHFIDGVVTSGELIAEAVRRFSSIERVVSIPGGVASPRRMRSVHDGPLRIGYAGRIEQIQKRIFDLPLLAAELTRRGVPFVLRVAGSGSAEGELRRELPAARFDGWLSVEKLYEEVYPELDVLVHFAEWEGLTIAPREAMVHGVVPVVSRFPGAEDFADGVNALTFPIGDVVAAADCIERLHRDRALLEQLSRNAGRSQQGIRSETGAMDAWESLIRDVMNAPPRAGASLPPAPRDSGFLTRIGLADGFAERLRALRRRGHTEPGSEWPHWSGQRDPEIEGAFARHVRGGTP